MSAGRTPAAEIAVVIPTYNRASTIRRALDSVLRVNDAAIELAVADDASTDATLEVLRRVDDPRLRVIEAAVHRNGNVARNAGIAATTAPLVAFLDSDDVFLAGRIERLRAFFAANPDVDALLDGFVVVEGERREEIRHREGAVTTTEWIDLLIAHALPLTCSAIAVRRHALVGIGGFDASLERHQDRDLLMRLVPGHRVAVGSGCDVVKYQSSDSFSRKAKDYMAGLDAFAARHPALLEPQRRDVLAYLVARGIMRPLLAGRFGAALGERRALAQAKTLPRGFLSAVARYARGKAARRRLAAAFAARR